MRSSFKSTVAADLEGFLRFKRNLGYRYRRAEYILRKLDQFLSRKVHEQKTSFRVDDALIEFLASRPNRKGLSVSQDMSVIRRFWDYLRRTHPREYRREILWPKLPTKSYFTPYIYSTSDIRALLKSIDHWEEKEHRILFRTVFLVLYCTGLRFGEVSRLRMRDVDLRRRVFFILESKFRSRWVPYHRSLGRELERYLKARQKIGQYHKSPDSPFFIRDERRSVSVPWISNTLRDFLRKIGLKPSHGRIGPRPYDTRHTFAVHRLTRWYREGVDLHARLAWLSAYMGHLNLAGTEIYLTATPELMALASHRFNKRYKAGKKTP